MKDELVTTPFPLDLGIEILMPTGFWLVWTGVHTVLTLPDAFYGNRIIGNEVE